MVKSRRIFLTMRNASDKSCRENQRSTGRSKSLCAPDDYNPHTIHDLKMAVTEYEDIRNVDRSILNTVFENTVRRVNKCLETGGGHFEHNLKFSVL